MRFRHHLSQLFPSRRPRPNAHGSKPSRRLRLEALEDRCVPAIFTVTKPDAFGPGSLWQAMFDAETTPNVGGPDEIHFNIDGPGVHTIYMNNSLPIIADPLIIDGYTQGQKTPDPSDDAKPNELAVGDNADLKIEINGSAMSQGTNLFIFRGNNSMVRGLAITHVPGTAFNLANGFFASHNTIVGNFIGTDASGTAYSADSGVAIEVGNGDLATGNVIGGLAPADRNVITGSGAAMIVVRNAVGTLIQGNYIGVNKDGTAPLQPLVGTIGVVIGADAHHNTIGGTAPGTGNVILGTITGIVLAEAGGITGSNVIQGNIIGANATGTAGLGGGIGIQIGTHNDTIGGSAAGAGNLISGNTTGIFLLNGSPGPTIQGNKIGTDVTGTLAVPNSGDGFYIYGVGGATIGGTGPGEGNTIAFNGRYGAFINQGHGWSLSGNSIFANGGRGIRLFVNGNDTQTENDAGDGDDGANGFQNYPELTEVVGGSTTTVTGTLNSTSSTTFRLEFFANATIDPTGYGEGETYLGFTDVTTDGGGNASFSVNLAAHVPAGQFVTATATDPGGNTSEFSFNRIVTQANRAPVASNDAYSVNEDGTLSVSAPGVLGNDTDADGNPIQAMLVSGPAHGTLTLNANGSFNYVPAANYYGPDSFAYKATDGQANSNVATVALAVNAINDVPVANPEAYSIGEDSILTVAAAGVLTNDTDADGDPISAILVSGPAHGTLTLNGNGSFTYTPVANYFGPDTFTYKGNDGQGDSNTATVALIVAPVNDAPNANPEAYTVAEDGALTVAATGVLANDTDADGDSLSAILMAGPAHGTLTLNGNGSFTYTPVADYFGSDAFTYKASDGSTDSNIVTVTLTITAVNDAPIANPEIYTVAEDNTLVVPAAGILANDTDFDADALSAILVAGPSHGTLTLNADGSFRYTPDANFNGGDRFVYKAGDGTAESNQATVNLNVTPVNDSPVALIDGYSMNQDGSLSVAAPGVLANDSDVEGATLTAALVSGPTHGSLTLNVVRSFAYVPAPTFGGTDSFVYEAGDGELYSAPTTVTIVVNPVSIGTPGKITGGGSVDERVRNFGFVVQTKVQDGVMSYTGNLEYQDKARGYNLHSTSITLIRVDPDGVHGMFQGTATLNGVAGYTFTVWVEDNGEPGSLVDRFRIEINGPGGFHYDSNDFATRGGLLDRGGNIQVHRAH